MKRISINRDWQFRNGTFAPFGENKTGRHIDLPHDFIIESDPSENAPGGASTGFYEGGVGTYVKMLDIPADWTGKTVLAEFDGVYMNAAVELNGQLVARHHYGYTPFHADLTHYLRPGKANRLTVIASNPLQPNSRWYAGGGIYRNVDLLVSGAARIAPWGIFAYTDHITDGTAFVRVETTIENSASAALNAWVETSVPGADAVRAKIYAPAGGKAVARVLLAIKDARIWDIDDPQLYNVKSALITDDGLADEDSAIFGVRTISVDAVNGFMLNGRKLKLKGGCIHHDNGLLGSESYCDSEYRKIKIHKDNGYNAIRTAHNPPSRDMLNACDQLGVLVMDEAFDCWRNGKNVSDYSLYFDENWESDIEAFITRDRNHPSIIIWSTGNEIVERGGISEGYLLADKLAAKMRSLDHTRFIANALCSLWNGLEDDELEKIMAESAPGQNSETPFTDRIWGERTEAFISPLDIVGYNYINSRYAKDSEAFKGRVICGTESFPNDFDNVWRDTMALDNVIGDFTWTSYDYIGEAGIGKSAFFEGEPAEPMGMMSHKSEFPWRLANDSDFDICGFDRPQLGFRKVVWGCDRTFVYVQNPARFGLNEVISRWGFEELYDSWNWAGSEGKPIRLAVFSGADEVELLVNGKSLGRKPAGAGSRYRAYFETAYAPGEATAISYVNGTEISRAVLTTTGAPKAITLTPEKMSAVPGGLCFVTATIVDGLGRRVPDGDMTLTAEVEGEGALAAFGSANPITTENYTTGKITTFGGRAQAILRAGDMQGAMVLKVKCALGEASVRVAVK